MSRWWWLAAMMGAGASLQAQDWLDRVEENLTFSGWNDRLRARLSGTLDLEYYHTSDPPFGLFESTASDLFNPRLTLFVDAQFGAEWYAFLQARVDRGFDPADGAARMRLDEYVLRYTPWPDGRLSIQIGKFASIVGRWNARHLSWDNPFVTAPLPYNEPTPASDRVLPYPGIIDAYRAMGQSYYYLPILWNASYATGVSISGRVGKFDYAAELKNASLSSRPESWDVGDTGFDHPTVSIRAGYRPDLHWNLGFSASRGPYLREDFYGRLPRGKGVGDYEQLVLGQDISFEWHHLQLWAEFYEARFELPRVGSANTFAYFVEAKYKFSPQFYAALRWNQQLYDDIPNGDGGEVPWGVDLWQADAAMGYRFTAHTQLKVQYSLQRETTMQRDTNHLLALQFTTRF